ncbi:MAG TPA: DUF4184 family protein [Noviherbaspirillum sp.]
MPFTLAHPAAIIPISKQFRGRVSLSGLVIGSMTPDAVYFLPLGINGRTSHSLPALVWFCIPVGMAAYVVFHSFVKRPAAALLPAPVHSRLSPHLLGGPWFGSVSPGKVMVSVFIGALTHVGWDAFTHAHTGVVATFDFLRMTIGTIGSYRLPLYKLLQHASSLAGLLALALWAHKWFVGARPVQPATEEDGLSQAVRVAVIAAILGSGIAAGIARGASTAYRAVEHIVVQATVGGMIGAGVAGIVFCLGWHIYMARRSRYA